MLDSISLGTWVLIAMGHVLACVLIYWDSSNRCDYGWLWFICCVFCPPLVIVYIILRALANRGPGAREEFKRKLERAQQGPRTISEVERLHYLARVADGAGTLYEGPAQSHGFRHFTDTQAEALLRAGEQEAAFQYLRELYADARAGNDGVRLDTYLYYICQLPEGAARLEEWLAASQGAARGASPGAPF
jgi:hypothetical protein